MAEDDAQKAPLRIGKTRLISMDDLDRRTNAARIALETQDAIISDLGGADGLSTLERLAAQHAALAAAVVNDAYTRWLKGEEVSLPELACVQNCYLRIAGALGFARRAKDLTKSIDHYLEEGNDSE